MKYDELLSFFLVLTGSLARSIDHLLSTVHEQGRIQILNLKDYQPNCLRNKRIRVQMRRGPFPFLAITCSALQPLWRFERASVMIETRAAIAVPLG